MLIIQWRGGLSIEFCPAVHAKKGPSFTRPKKNYMLLLGKLPNSSVEQLRGSTFSGGGRIEKFQTAKELITRKG